MGLFRALVPGISSCRVSARGRRVIVATLTGLGTDADALSEGVTLDTHIRDIVSLLEREDLHDVVLVGHSYAGMIITGAAEHARDRIRHLVYVDALVPEHGDAGAHIMPQRTGDTFRRLAGSRAAVGGCSPPRSSSISGVSKTDRRGSSSKPVSATSRSAASINR